MLLSILIRNRNESASLLPTLNSIKKQLVDFSYEIIFIDNESDDDSMKIAKSFNCKIFIIPRNNFSYGHALNYGISKCHGKYILILSAHLILLNELFLQEIPDWFSKSNVGGLRFIIPDSNLPALLAGGVKTLVYSNDESYMNMHWKSFLVNHCAAVRRSAWELLKFDEDAMASEDKIWSLGILQKGYCILYNIPLFYVYVKPFGLALKLERSGIEEAAKQKITGQIYRSTPLLKHLCKGFRRAVKQWKMERTISRSVRDHLR